MAKTLVGTPDPEEPEQPAGTDSVWPIWEMSAYGPNTLQSSGTLTFSNYTNRVNVWTRVVPDA